MFLAGPQEIIEFFKKIHITDLDMNTRNNVIHIFPDIIGLRLCAYNDLKQSLISEKI